MTNMIIELLILQTWEKSIGEWHLIRVEKNAEKDGYIYRCQIKLGVIFFRIIQVIDRKKLMVSHSGDYIISVLRISLSGKCPMAKKHLSKLPKF